MDASLNKTRLHPPAGISRVKDPAKSYLNATNDTGTPMYMAPEQFNGTRVDEKARLGMPAF